MPYKEKQITKHGKPFMLLVSYLVLLFLPVIALLESYINKTKYRKEIKTVWKSLILK